MQVRSFGKYHIRRELGRGAMGVVYEAHDPDRGVDVALKVLTFARAVSPESRRRREERFDQEAEALAGLSHLHVVRAFDRGAIGGQPYFTMELVRGTTLRDRLQFQGALSGTELLRLVNEMCDALDHIHAHGVVHRDIKPENIMLLPDGRSKLMDFGIARVVAAEDPTQMGGFHGSPAYMSPEQVSGLTADARSDIYALAVTLYEAATGRRAFEGENISVITRRVTSEYPPPPAGLPPHFQVALMRGMAKDPSQRYSVAGEMAADIRSGRVPAHSFSPVSGVPGSASPFPHPAAPAVAQLPVPTIQSSPRPVYLGESPAARGSASPEAPPAPAPVARQVCRMHPNAAGVQVCTACGHAMCYACYLEVPGRGVICRSCAFGGR